MWQAPVRSRSRTHTHAHARVPPRRCRAGKKLLVQKYKAAGETKGAEYFERVHSSATFTYAEVNERLSHEPEDQVEATVPTQSNGIERENLNQKAVRRARATHTRTHSRTQVHALALAVAHTRRVHSQVNAWKREDCTSFLGSAFAALSQRSMSDLSFSQEMPRGYTTRQNISKEVWTAKFFAEVQAELVSPTGLDKLVWAATKIGPGVLVMASRALRSELVDDLGVLIGQPASQHVKLLRACTPPPRDALTALAVCVPTPRGVLPPRVCVCHPLHLRGCRV